MTKLAFGPLRTLDTPVQARALARVHQILQATADLLGTRTLRDLSTTSIAAHAEIPVSSIYRYFPDLDAVLRELYLQTAGALREELFTTFADVTRNPGWRDRLGAALDVQRAYLARHPFYRRLLLHFVVARAAVAIEDEEHNALVDFLEARWRSGLDGFHGGKPEVVAKTTVQIALSMEDLIATQVGPDASRPFSQELSKVLEGYLVRYLED